MFYIVYMSDPLDDLPPSLRELDPQLAFVLLQTHGGKEDISDADQEWQSQRSRTKIFNTLEEQGEEDTGSDIQIDNEPNIYELNGGSQEEFDMCKK